MNIQTCTSTLKFAATATAPPEKMEETAYSVGARKIKELITDISGAKIDLRHCSFEPRSEWPRNGTYYFRLIKDQIPYTLRFWTSSDYIGGVLCREQFAQTQEGPKIQFNVRNTVMQRIPRYSTGCFETTSIRFTEPGRDPIESHSDLDLFQDWLKALVERYERFEAKKQGWAAARQRPVIQEREAATIEKLKKRKVLL